MTPATAPRLLHPPTIDFDADGIPERAWVPSASKQGVYYELERSPRGEWMHVTATCEGWTARADCYHVRVLKRLTEEIMADDEEVTTRALARASVLDVVEQLDERAIITALEHATAGAIETWCYSFPQDGQTIVGLSIDGIQEAAREMARRGEPIEEEWVRLDREDETSAYFSAKAIRYGIGADGQRVALDSAIRTKRVEKFTKLRTPRRDERGNLITHVENRYWYEVGAAKAARNAKEALLPEGIKRWMIDTAKSGGHIGNASGGNGNGQRRSQERAPARQQAPRGPQAGSQRERPSPSKQRALDVMNWAARGAPGSSVFDVPMWTKKQQELRKQYPALGNGGGGLNLDGLKPDELIAVVSNLEAWRASLLGEPPPDDGEEAPQDGEYRAVEEEEGESEQLPFDGD